MTDAILTSGLNTNNSNQENSNIDSNFNKNVKSVLKLASLYAIMFGVGEKYFALFAHQLNAPLSFFAALIWIPLSLGPFIQIIAANVLDRYQNRLKIIYFSILIQACSFIPIIMIAFWGESLHVSAESKGMTISLYIFILSITVYYVSGNFYTPLWQSFIGDLVSPEKRGKFIAQITKYNFIFTLVCQSLVGFAFYLVAKHLNNSNHYLYLTFTGCFLLAFIARFTSFRTIKRLNEVPYQNSENSSFSFWAFIKRAPESNFVKFVFFVAVFQGGANIASPYFVPYWIDTLKHSNADWTILSSGSLISSIFALILWSRFADNFGNKKTITYCAIIVSIMPFFWLVSGNFYYLVALEMVSEVFWTGFNLCTLSYIYEAASPPKRARCFAYYNLILGIGILVGTQFGLWGLHYFSTEVFGAQYHSSFCWILIASGIVRLLACLIFMTSFKELREVKPFDLKAFWVDVIQLRSFFGFSVLSDNNENSKILGKKNER